MPPEFISGRQVQRNILAECRHQGAHTPQVRAPRCMSVHACVCVCVCVRVHTCEPLSSMTTLRSSPHPALPSAGSPESKCQATCAESLLNPHTALSGPVHLQSGIVMPSEETKKPRLREAKKLVQGHIYLVGQSGFEPRCHWQACVFPTASHCPLKAQKVKT